MNVRDYKKKLLKNRSSFRTRALWMAALLICGLVTHSEAQAERTEKVNWYWVNTVRKNMPDCLPMDEEPISSLSRKFGNVNMRIVHNSDTKDGRLLMIELDDRDGSTTFAYATTELMCKRLKTAIDAVQTDIQGSVQTVSPASLMALPEDYKGKTVQFTVRASGGLRPDSPGVSRVYIDEHRYLTPILRGAVLRRWLEERFVPSKVYRVTFRGKVRPNSLGSFVDFEVEDFRRE